MWFIVYVLIIHVDVVFVSANLSQAWLRAAGDKHCLASKVSYPPIRGRPHRGLTNQRQRIPISVSQASQAPTLPPYFELG